MPDGWFPHRKPPPAAAGLLVLLATLSASSPGVAQVPVVRPKVLAAHPHDTTAFTQGLLLHEGRFFESTGQYGRSTLREVAKASGEVIRSVSLDRSLFAEGLALVGDRLIQLTWQNHLAYEYDLKSFEQTRSFEYEGEGWGLCFDGSRLVMTDGSGSLFFRDAKSFELQGQVAVTIDGAATTRLNELECVGELVYANVWQKSEILRIDPKTGKVLTRIDASELVKEQVGRDVLNGIAFDSATERFFLTGKLWSKVYETEFAFAAGEAPASTPEPEGESPTPPGAVPSDARAAPSDARAAPSDARAQPPARAKPDPATCGCTTVGNAKSPGFWQAALGLLGFLLRRRS